MPIEWLEKAGVCCCSTSEMNHDQCYQLWDIQYNTPRSCLTLGKARHRSLAFGQETFPCKPFKDPILQTCPNLYECYTSMLSASNMQYGYYHKNTFLQFLICHRNNISPDRLLFSTLKSLCSKEAEAIQCHLTLHFL